MDIGSIVMKTAGRDAGKRAAIIEIEGNMALIDGETRRRKTNLAHLEPTGQKVDLKKSASHDDVKKALESLKITVRDTKPKTAGERPKKVRKAKENPVEAPAKKATKKTADTEEKEAKPDAKAPAEKKAAPKKPRKKNNGIRQKS
ncbi:MAG: hypothetical protein O2779_01080 [Nanoarchaeota archaeon]|nr:hypothetical protein [Nanoarchaeota archaeon]